MILERFPRWWNYAQNTTFFNRAHYWSADSPDRDTLRKFIRDGQLTNLLRRFGRKGILLSPLKLSGIAVILCVQIHLVKQTAHSKFDVNPSTPRGDISELTQQTANLV